MGDVVNITPANFTSHNLFLRLNLSAFFKSVSMGKQTLTTRPAGYPLPLPFLGFKKNVSMLYPSNPYCTSLNEGFLVGNFFFLYPNNINGATNCVTTAPITSYSTHKTSFYVESTDTIPENVLATVVVIVVIIVVISVMKYDKKSNSFCEW